MKVLVVNGLIITIISLIASSLLNYFWPEMNPFEFFQFWEIQGSLWEGVLSGWPLYIWGIALSAFRIISKKTTMTDLLPSEILTMGFYLSSYAGIAEEIVYRWLLFFAAIIGIQFSDWLLFGFMDIHLIQWIFTSIICPVANFFTLGYLESYLMNGYGWAVAAAIIIVNGHFRDGHSYQGLFGFTNSWFLGMYFFWVMFNSGLIAAMIVHFTYNFLIFSIRALHSALRD